MPRRWAALAAVLVALVALAGPLAGGAGATHDDETLWVTVSLKAAGEDRISVSDDIHGPDQLALASEVAMALGRAPGSFRAVDDLDGADAVLDDKLAVPDGRGRMSYELDTGRLQLLAERRTYESVAVRVCTPRVRQLVDVLDAPQSLPVLWPGMRCRGWFRLVDERPVRAAVELAPDRHRYPSAVARTVGVAAITFGLLGIGSTLLRRGPLKRRSVGSWLLAAGSALGVTTVGWAVVSVALWWTGATADAVLLGNGSEAEQVGRMLVPGLAFVVPALLPAAILLTVPPREKAGPLPPPSGPPEAAWWPMAWWPEWAAQQPAQAHGGAPPVPSPPGSTPPEAPPGWGGSAGG